MALSGRYVQGVFSEDKDNGKILVLLWTVDSGRWTVKCKKNGMGGPKPVRAYRYTPGPEDFHTLPDYPDFQTPCPIHAPPRLICNVAHSLHRRSPAPDPCPAQRVFNVAQTHTGEAFPPSGLFNQNTTSSAQTYSVFSIAVSHRNNS